MDEKTMNKVFEITDALEIDKAKVWEAIPAIAIILEDADLVDYATDLWRKNNEKWSNEIGFKIMLRLIAKAKNNDSEWNDVLSYMFGIETKGLTTGQKIQYIQKLLLETDITTFFG